MCPFTPAEQTPLFCHRPSQHHGGQRTRYPQTAAGGHLYCTSGFCPEVEDYSRSMWKPVWGGLCGWSAYEKDEGSLHTWFKALTLSKKWKNTQTTNKRREKWCTSEDWWHTAPYSHDGSPIKMYIQRTASGQEIWGVLVHGIQICSRCCTCQTLLGVYSLSVLPFVFVCFVEWQESILSFLHLWIQTHLYSSGLQRHSQPTLCPVAFL